jgi:hypothetical protein
MRKTLFAGLTVLSPDESILSDDGSFIGADRDTIDRFLEIGAKTHRHTGLSGLSNPGLELEDVTAIPSGGTIAGDTVFTFGYSLLDAEGGETLLSPTSTLTTPPALEQPLYAPYASIDYTAGALLADTYYYELTFIDAEGGETPPGAWVSVEREPGFANARVLLSNISTGVAAASAVGWRLYRAVGGGTFDYLASGGVANDTFTDDGTLSPQCDIHPPPDEVNTTNQINQLRVKLPSASMIDGATSFRLYGTNTGAFLGDVLLGAYPASSAGQTVYFHSFAPDPGAPPDRNHSIGGASKIDPDTELLDWHWKRPVAASASLPSGTKGDVRLVFAASALYYLPEDGTGPPDWDLLTGSGGVSVGGGGGGSGGAMPVRSEDRLLGLPGVDYGQVAPGAASALLFERQEGQQYPALVFFVEEQGDDAAVRGQVVTPFKQYASATPPGQIPSLASGASAATYANFTGYGSEWAILLAANKACRVTFYSEEAAQIADIGRPFNTPPSGNHGVLLDVQIPTAGGGRRRIVPTAHLYGILPDFPTDPNFPTLISTSSARFFTITNLEGTGVVDLAIGVLPGPD